MSLNFLTVFLSQTKFSQIKDFKKNNCLIYCSTRNLLSSHYRTERILKKKKYVEQKHHIKTISKCKVKSNHFNGFHWIHFGKIIQMDQVFLTNVPSFAPHARWEQLQMASKMCSHSCSSRVFINFNKGPRHHCHKEKHISNIFSLSPFVCISNIICYVFWTHVCACVPAKLVHMGFFYSLRVQYIHCRSLMVEMEI